MDFRILGPLEVTDRDAIVALGGSLTDGLVDRANAKLELARVLAALNRRDEAIPEARAALALFLTKGDRPGAEQTRSMLKELEAAATTQASG